MVIFYTTGMNDSKLSMLDCTNKKKITIIWSR